MIKRILEDIDTAKAKDPAARNRLEIALTYPGVHALWGHRISHFLWRINLKLIARIHSNLFEVLLELRSIQRPRLGVDFLSITEWE